MINLSDYFGRVHVINLDCCPERWEKFQEVAEKKGITGFERFRAIHGDTCAHPAWWRAGNGAWGCLMSHLRICQDALMDGLDSYLVLEDDTVFCSDFETRLPKLMEKIKHAEWHQLYLGGQHLYRESSPPWPYREGAVRCKNVNRTHAMAIHKRFMLQFSQHIMHAPDYLDNWIQPEEGVSEFFRHIDHQLGVLHERQHHLILGADPWLCGQGENKSNVNGNVQEEQWWHDKGWY